jgi:hypothetical protein
VSEQSTATPLLPSALVSRADLSRLVRDIETIDNELEAQRARNHATGQSGYHLPTFSKGLADFAELNKLDLADDHLRMKLKEQMKVMKEKAPVIHMTFAVEADPSSLAKLVEYIRKEIHPQALLSVGLQPAIVGGVYLRTPNHIFDLSVRSRLSEARSIMAQDIESMANVIKVVEAPPEIPLDENGAPIEKPAPADTAVLVDSVAKKTTKSVDASAASETAVKPAQPAEKA